MRDKYKKEIEEILRKAGEVAPKDSNKESERHPEDRPRETRTARRAPVQEHRVGPRRWTITPGKMMLAGLVLFLIGFLAIRPLIWLGLAALVGGYLMYFLKPRSINQEKRWRGRSVEETTSSPLDWLKRRFKG